MSKSVVNKYEIMGIFGSVAAMALLLAFMTVDNDDRLVISDDVAGSQGAIVVASDPLSDSHKDSIDEALVDAFDSTNTLQALVVDDVLIGSGSTADTGDTLVVHYTGATRDGNKFDSSYDRGEPFALTLGEGRVIEGWEKGLVGMKEGGKRVIVIPPSMGYGDRQVGPIPADSVLVFVVELLSIEE